MEEFYPSEIARLVLGYLKEVDCNHAWKTFVQESFDLREYYNLYQEGKVYTTNVNGKSLIDTLREYCSFKSSAGNRNSQNNFANNAFRNNEAETPHKVTENTKVVNQMVQTSSSTPVCQTPKRRSKCRVTQLNFDHETECVDKSTQNDDASGDELSCSNSTPNSAFKTNCAITNNTLSKSVMTISVKLCDISVQTDLNFNYKEQNVCSIGIQTENLYLCLPSLSKSSLETFQTNTKQTSCSVSDTNEINVHISSSPDLSNTAGYSEQNNHDSRTANICDKVEENVSSSNNKSVSEITNCGKCIESDVLTDEMSQSPVLEKLGNKASNREEIFPKRVGNSPVSNHIHQTVTATGDLLENMDVTDEDATKDNLTLPPEGTAFEKNSYNSNQKTAEISSSNRYNERNVVLTENSTDMQNKSITSEPDNQLSVNNETTEFPKEVSNPLEGDKLPGHENLSLENNSDGFESNFDNQEIARSYCDSQLNNSDVSTKSSSKLDVCTNELENMTSSNLNTYSEKCQDSNSEYISSELEKNQPDLESVKCNIPSNLTNTDKICTDLPGNAETQKDSEYSNLTEFENKASSKCLSDVSPEKSKTDTVSENDFPNDNTNKEVTNIGAKNKSQAKNVNSEVCQSSDNNNQNTVSKVDKSEKMSVNGQIKPTVVSPLTFNNPSLLISNPSVPTYQSVPSGSFFQNNGQYQYFMILPVQTVPPVPAVPVSVANPVLPSTGTVLMSTNNLNMAKNEKAAISPSNSDKVSPTVNTPSKQNIVVPSPIRSCSKDSDKMPSAVNTPSKPNLVVPSPVRSSSKSDKNSHKMPSIVNTPSKPYLVVPSPIRSSSKSDKNFDKMPSATNTPSKQDIVVPSPIRSSPKSDRNKGKPAAHLITSSPINNKVAASEIQTPSKKRLKGQAECTTCLTLDQNSSLSPKTPKKKDKKSKKKKKPKQKDLTESVILNKKKSIKAKKKSSKASKKNNKQNLDKEIISSGLPSSSSVENTSLTKNLDCHSILPSFKSPSHSNLSAVFKETSEITDHDDMEKECRVLKVLVSDVLKSSHVRCLDFNVDSTVDKSKKENHDKEFCGENNGFQLKLQTGEISCESSETDCSFIDKDIKISKNVTSSCRNEKRSDTFVTEINTAESILTYKTDNFATEKNQCPISSPCSALPNIDEFNSEGLNSTDAIVKEITTALANCLDDVPDSIEVVVYSDSEEMNKEGETINSQCSTADIGDLPDCQEVNQKNLNTEWDSVERAEEIKNHVNAMSTINKTLDCENDPAVIDMDCRTLPEALDLDNTEQNNATIQHQEVENITSENCEKDYEQNLADNISITKVGNHNFELCTAASIDFNSERDDLDSSRSLMINTSPINEEENAETLENSLILSDSESVENDSLSDPVCESNHYSNAKSEELVPLSNSTVANVSLHDETQNRPCNINEKIDSSGIHHSPKNHPVPANLPSSKEKSNVNQIIEISTHDEDYKNFQLHNRSEKKANLHLPQGIIDSVKYFNSQSKTRKHVNVKNPSNSGLNSIDKSTVRSNTTTTFDPTSNSLPAIHADKCKSVTPCKILSPVVNVETARNENLNPNINFVQHLDSSVNKDLNNDVTSCDDVEKATLSSNNDTKQFSSDWHNMEEFVTDIDFSYLYRSKINYSRPRTSLKKCMRRCSYDSSASHGKAETLSSGHIIFKSKYSKSLENITNEKLYVQTDIHRKFSSTEPVYSHNCELKTSLNQHRITHSSSLSMHSVSLKQDGVSKNSVNCTSDANSHTEIVSHEGNSQLPTTIRQTVSRKLSAKRYLLEEDSNSDEDSTLMKEKDTIADKFSNKRILLEKDAHTQAGKYSARKCMLKNDALSPGRTRKTSSPNVKIINTRLEEVKNQINSDHESSKNVQGRKEPIQSVGKKLNDFNQTPGDEVSNASPEKDEIQTISEIACLDNGKDFPRRSVRYKRKSSDSLPSEECSVVSCSDDRLTLKKNHYLDNNQVYENDSNLTKRPKLDSRSSSPHRDNLNDAYEEDASHLTSDAISVESSFIANEYPGNKRIEKNIKSDVMEDSPVRCVSYKKKTNKSALRKRLEKDPNIPPGVKIPSKWNATKIINYSHAIGHSISDSVYSKKNVAKNRKRQSRPTLKISSIQSPSKRILSDEKNLSSKLSSLNCLPEGSTQRSTVCNKVLKNDKQQKSKRTVKKSKKLDSQENIKLDYEQTVIQNTKKKTVTSISAEPMEVQSQVSSQNASLVNQCETTQDIVEADIGRSDENGSELANAIASVERELVNLSPDSAPESSEVAVDDDEMSTVQNSDAIDDNCEPESSEVAIDDEMSTVQNSDAIDDNCEPEGIKQASLECVSEHSKLLMLLEKIRSMGVDKVLEKIYTLEEEKK